MKRQPDSRAAIIASAYPIARGTHGRTSIRGTSITAAAQILQSGRYKDTIDRDKRRPSPQDWQKEAWDLRDEIGELRFIADRQARACSITRMYIGRKEAHDSEPAPIDDDTSAASALGHILFGNTAAVEQTVKRAAQHLICNGETMLVVEGKDDQIEWSACSTQEVSGQPGEWKIYDGTATRHLEPDAIVIRCWNPHPWQRSHPDAPVRAVLPVLRELKALTQYAAAQIDSRLAGAGMLLLPEGIESMSAQDPTIPDEERKTFDQELIEYFMTPLKDRSSVASVVPFLSTLPAELIEKIQHITFWSELDQHVPAMRDEAIRRIGLGMDSDPALLLGAATSNHWCMDDQSEVYTRRGWVRHNTIQIGDECLSLDHSTGLTVWKPVTDIYRADVTDEPMLSIEGRSHSSLTTMGHRWPVVRMRWDGSLTWSREWATSREIAYLAEHGTAQLPTKITRGAPHANIPTAQKHEDALVELVAWYFTEGTTGIRDGRRTPQVSIHQSYAVNPDHCARIRNALVSLFGPRSESLDKGGRYATQATMDRCAEARAMRAAGHTVREIAESVQVSTTQVYKYLKQDPKIRDNQPRWREIRHPNGMAEFRLNAASAEVITEHAPKRVVPTEFVEELTHAQLLLFVDTAVRADGHVHGANRVITQKDPAMLAAFERACLLLGYAANHRVISVEGFATHHAHRMIVSDQGVGYRPRAESVSVVPYTGVVWCPTVADTHTMLMRRNGRVSYTGNSQWSVSEDEVRFGVAPIMSTICHALTHGLLHPLLKQQNFDGWEGLQAWFDTTPLTLRPDRSKDAQLLHERGVISTEVLLRENGFGTDDAPDKDEQKTTSLWRLLEKRPDLAEQILPELGIDLDVPSAKPAEPTPDEAPAADEKPKTADEPDNSPPDPDTAQPEDAQ